MATAMKIDPARFTALDSNPQAMLGEDVIAPVAITDESKQPIKIDPSRFTADTAAPMKIDPARFTPETPAADDRNLVERAADLPYVGQVVKGLALGGGDLKALGYRALAKGADFARAVQPGFQGDLAEASTTFGGMADAETQATNAMEERFAQGSSYGGNIGRGITRSLGTMAPVAMTMGPAAAILEAVGIQGNQSLEEGKKAGLVGEELNRYVGSQMLMEGVPAAAMQFAGLGGVEKQLGEPIKAGIREALKRTGFSVIQELPEELVTTLGQQLNDQQFGVRELTYDSAKQAAMDTALTVLGTVGLVGAAQYRRGGPTSPVGTTSGATPVETAPAQNDAPAPMEDEGFEVTDVRGLSEVPATNPSVQPRPVQTFRPTGQTNMEQQPVAEAARNADPFAGKEFEGKQGTAATFKTSEPIEITDKYGSYKVSYQITDDGDGFRLQRIDEDGTKSHLGDDGFWYKTDQPMPNRRDYIVLPEKYRTEAQAQQAAMEDAASMGAKKSVETPARAEAEAEAAAQWQEMTGGTAPAVESEADRRFREYTERTERMMQGLPVEATSPPPAPTPVQPEIVAPRTPKVAKPPVASSTGPTPASPESAGVSKQPWEMTRDEYHTYNAESIISDYEGGGSESRGYAMSEKVKPLSEAEKADIRGDREFSDRNRRSTVEAALRDGKPVPSAVLADYPDLAPRAVQEPVAAATKFKTAKGSTYQVQPDGSTIRDKAARPEHPGEQGIQPQSTKTFYVTPSDATRLAEVQAKGGPRAEIVSLPDGSGRVGLRYIEGKDAGKFEGRTIVDPKPNPEVGLVPVEIWNDGKSTSNHFGNEIVEVSPALPAPPKRPAPPRKGSTSTTGWSTVAKGVARKDIMGRNVEIVRQADGSWSVTRDEQEMDSGYKSRAEAEKYADGELAQDIRDQRNAEEEERGLNLGSLPSKASISDPGNEIARLRMAARKAETRYQKLHSGEAYMEGRAFSMPSKAKVEEAKQKAREAWDRLAEAKARAAKVETPRPAVDIFSELTDAYIQGKKFVEDLHVRIAPTLARIHAAAKSPVEFLRSAVAKIGEHIRPYVRRFLQDVRKVNAEFAANPTRGSVPTRDRAPLANPGTTPDARGFVEKVDEERQTPSEQTRDQWEAEANKLDKGEVLGKLQTGQTFQNAAEVIAGKRITDEAAWNAIYTGENIAESWKIADAWRRTGTEAARILGARFDPILSASERATVAKTNADIAAIDQQLDDKSIPKAQFDALIQQRIDLVQSINEIKMTGTARRMLAEIFTSPRKSTDRKLKAIDKKLEDASISPADRARLTKSREAISNAEGKALEEMRRRMLKSGIPLGSPTEMRKRDNILEALREAKAHKSTFTDKLEELYKNILFSASTLKNIISNTAFFASEYGIVRPMEAALNSALKIDSRAAKVSNLGPMLAATAPGIRRGVRNMLDSFRTEVDMFELQTHGPNMNISGKLESRGAAIPGRLGRIIRSMGYRPLMASDSFNKSVVAELEVANYANSMATEKGLKGRDRVRFIQRQTLDYDSPSWKHAVEVAERMTLTDESGAAVRKATEIRDAIPPLRFLLPIIKTPAKELSRALQMTPLGTARIAYKLYRDPVYTRKHLARDVAEQAAAWTIAIGLYAAFAPGDDDDTGLPLITGNQPYSRNRAAEGKNKGAITPPKSIRIGDRWYSYAAGGAPATGLAAVVDGLEGITDGKKDPLTALSEFMVKFMGNVKDQTFLSNLADLMDAFEEGGFPKWAGNFAASWSPSMLKRVAKGADPIEREMRAMSPLERLNYQILPTPSAPAKADLFGRTVKKPESPVGPRGDLLWRVAGNTQVTDLGDRTPFENDMYRMFLNWNNQHKEERWAPSLPDTDYKLGEKKAKWTPAEYERLSTLAGQKALETLVKINASKPFNFDRPTKFDRAKVDKVFELARKYARTTMIREKVRAGRE
jgi:hypothetical protein